MFRRFRLELILLALAGVVLLVYMLELDLLLLGRRASSTLAALFTPGRVLVGTGIFVTVWLVLWRIRWHLTHYDPMYSRTCPHGHRDRLVRVHRTWRDNLAGLLVNLPLRRYACKECGWHGLRISRHSGFPLDEFFKSGRDRSRN